MKGVFQRHLLPRLRRNCIRFRGIGASQTQARRCVRPLVLPLTAAVNGLSWDKFARMLSANYVDYRRVEHRSASGMDMSFSSDTGMAECLVIARRGVRNENAHATYPPRICSSHLSTADPQKFEHAAAIAKR